MIDEQKTRQTKNATNQNKECVFFLLTFKSKKKTLCISERSEH